jgi:hypothetical protein
MSKQGVGWMIWGLALSACGTPNGAETSGGNYRASDSDASFVRAGAEAQGDAVDCKPYDSYMASLATLTANCRKTLDPHAYEIDRDGFLVPRFGECSDGDVGKVRSIRQLLSLQQRPDRLPHAKACMAGRYATALAEFENGDAPCPKWEFVRTENPITAEVVADVEGKLPRLPSNDPLPPGILDGDLPALETINLYAVAFADEAPAPAEALAASQSVSGTESASKRPSQNATRRAIACASTFPGFVVGERKTPDGREGILTDPDSWLDSTVYTSASDDPYLRLTFYHPMSYFGGLPGVIFGDPNRAMPCGVDANGTPICIGESCSYFTGIHRRTRLQLDCNDYSNPNTCVSFCGPPLPPPPVLPQLPP